MQFKVPQDVLRPDRIVSFLTLRQLIIVAIGGGVAYSLYLILSKQYFVEVWLPPVLFVAMITIAFGFIKFHDILFEKLVLLYIEFQFRPRARVWKQMDGDVLVSVLGPAIQKTKGNNMPKVSEMSESERRKKLEEMTQLVDTHGKEMSKYQK